MDSVVNGLRCCRGLSIVSHFPRSTLGGFVFFFCIHLGRLEPPFAGGGEDGPGLEMFFVRCIGSERGCRVTPVKPVAVQFAYL